MLMMFGALFGSWYFETLYMQHVLGYSPLQAGLAFLPQTLLIAAGAQVTSRLVPKFGPRPLVVLGTLVAGGGLAWLTQISTGSTFVTDLLGPYVLIGLGMGLAVTPIAVAGTAGVPRERGGSRLRLAQHVTHGRRLHRPRRVGHGGGQPHLGPADRRRWRRRRTPRRP